jgi:two-component system NtrC family sensor kinase
MEIFFRRPCFRWLPREILKVKWGGGDNEAEATVKWGLRLQLLLLLGALMLLSYVPLFFATSTYTRVGLEQLQRANAEKLGRSVAAHLTVLRKQTDEETFRDLARAQVDGRVVHGLSLLRRGGASPDLIGEPDLIESLRTPKAFGGEPEVRELVTPLGPALFIFEPDPQGGVAALVRVDEEITQAASLARMMGLYMFAGGLGLLIVAYMAATRWIVRPIMELSRGADRIAKGGHRIEPLKQAPQELLNLSLRLGEMTSRLRSEEGSLRAKVEELTALTEQLRQTQNSLVRSERLATVGRLAAGLAHEVGNPISALMGLQDLMIEGGLSAEENADFLQRMRKETARIDRVLSDLLAYARPAGESPLRGGQGRPGSAGSAVEDALALLSPQGDFHGVHLSSQVEEGLPLVLSSQEELTQILLNLLMNAADACGAGGNVSVGVRLTDGQVEISVQDDGPGVAADVRDSLFEPFVSTKDVGKGTGLGLAVTKGLVESADGTIWVEDVKGGGARFVVRVPPVDLR